jgi:hypothetical protein
MGQTTVTAEGGGRFQFSELAPGAYDLLADGLQCRNPLGAYQRFFLDHDIERMILPLNQVPIIQLSIEDTGAKAVDSRAASVLIRRKDLSGEGSTMQVKDAMPVLPGHWEIAISTAADLYPVSIDLRGADHTRQARADAWNEFLIRGKSNLKVTVSSGPATVRGRVTQSINEPASGAPVYLEPFDPDTGKRLADVHKMLTDARGEYRFGGLPPGSYRIVSSFEFEDPDERTMESSLPKVIALKAASEVVQDLELYVRP